MRSTQIPAELRHRCLSHLKHVLVTRELTMDTAHLLRELSPPLRVEVALHSCQKLVMNMDIISK